jgi:DNA-binding IclR family transcriptional regulator
MAAKVVKSAERTVALFEFFARVRRPASATEVEDALQIPQSSASMLLWSLVELGYLEYLRDGRKFRPTLRVTLLGDWLKTELPADILTERLDELQRVTRETVLVGRRQGSELHYVYTLRPDEGLQFYVQQGARQPLSTSASGRIHLSVLDDQEIRQIIRRNAVDAGLRLDEEQILGAIAETRRTGLAETDTFISGERESHAIALLIPRKQELEPISLAIAGPKDRILKRRERIVEILRAYVEHRAVS